MENDWKATPEEREEINRLMQEAIEGLESLSAKVEQLHRMKEQHGQQN